MARDPAMGVLAADEEAPGAAKTASAGPAGRGLPPLQRRWVQRSEPPPAQVAQLRDALGLPDVLCKLLVVRGRATPDAIRPFLKPRLEHAHDPMEMAGMAAAIERIDRAIRKGETILVHGDYDVDGMCGASMYTKVLSDFGGRVAPFVPHRLRHGYDLSLAGVQAAQDARATLILTADCGTVAHGPIARAREAGIDVIVTDHHTPGDSLPPAVAVVNPNRSDCAYPDKHLAGTGVAYKLCAALAAARGADVDALRYHLDFVALATIADLAPLTGENRVFARYGLKLLAVTRNVGLRALLRTTRLDQAPEIAAGQVSHVLAPRLNAIGRMGDANLGVRLLLTDDEAEAARLAGEFERQNQIRRATDRETLNQALEQLEKTYDPELDAGLVLAGNGWHPGVIGIVASRVVERVHRPTVLVATEQGAPTGRGSARSVPGFHLYDAIDACGDLLERYGGHRQAAGLEVRVDRIDAFRDAFNRYAQEHLAQEDRQPRAHIDVEATLAELAGPVFRLLRHFGPFGIGNPGPVFLARNVTQARRWREVGEGHARMVLGQGDARLDAIGFSLAEKVRTLSGSAIDVIFQLQADRRTGRAQARIMDLRPAE